MCRQRMEIVSNGRRIVAEGRDITTVVAPDASVRILLTASEEARSAPLIRVRTKFFNEGEEGMRG